MASISIGGIDLNDGDTICFVANAYKDVPGKPVCCAANNAIRTCECPPDGRTTDNYLFTVGIMGHIFDHIYVSLRSSGAFGQGGGQYWSVQSDGTISACKKEIDQSCCFVLRPDATVGQRQFIFIQPFISNSKYVCPSGDGILGDMGQIAPANPDIFFLVRKNRL